MSTSTEVLPSVRRAFARLIDYAGLFPPAKLALGPAIDEYTASLRGRHAWMLGKFITPVSGVRALIDALPHSEQPLPLSAIVDAAADPRTWLTSAQTLLAELTSLREATERIAIEALEVPLPRLATKRESYDAAIGQCAMLVQNAGLRDVPIYVEFPRDERWSGDLDDAMAALKRYRMRAKVRCGGVVPEAFPSAAEFAHFIAASAENGVPFKATAGLHHPVRHFDDTVGTMMHGFLNVLGAVTMTPGAPREALERILDEERASAFAFEPEAFTVNGLRFTCDDVDRARGAFVAYGSCSFAEPVDDLTALGVLPK